MFATNLIDKVNATLTALEDFSSYALRQALIKHEADTIICVTSEIDENIYTDVVATYKGWTYHFAIDNVDDEWIGFVWETLD